jgi:anti-sigma regulatory factor (Ser/Thr protein kinase)
MPTVMCFEENPAETLSTIVSLRANLGRPSRGTRSQTVRSKRRNGQPRWLGRYRDFTFLKKITPAAALVLAAEYARWSELAGTSLWIADVESWNTDIIDTLWRIGFFNIIGFSSLPEQKLDPETVVLQMKSGNTADGQAVTDLLDELRNLLPELEGSKAVLVHLYGAMIDAVENVVGHAYPADIQTEYPHIGRWWMTGALDRKAKRTMAVVYDQGISIPVSLPRWSRYNAVVSRMRQIASAIGVELKDAGSESDGWAIESAVEESATSTGEVHRGKGLARMKDFVDECEDGYLRIISRRGQVVFRPRQKPLVSSNETSIGGTLIEWNVLL